MAAWDRRTPWRQGQALKDETAITLGLVREGETSSVVAMVVSHDCDLAQSPAVEPSVEVVVGGRIPAPDGNTQSNLGLPVLLGHLFFPLQAICTVAIRLALGKRKYVLRRGGGLF